MAPTAPKIRNAPRQVGSMQKQCPYIASIQAGRQAEIQDPRQRPRELQTQQKICPKKKKKKIYIEEKICTAAGITNKIYIPI